MKGQTHVTVLTEEAVEALAITKSSCVVDATLGSSGHARLIVSKLGKEGTFVGIDADKTSIENAREIFKAETSKVHLNVGNFRNIDSIVQQLHSGQVDAILADLGWRSEQFSGSGKGFSFQSDEDLIMTLGNPEDYPFVAKDIVNDWEEGDIKNVLVGYGEEKFASRIAKGIVEERKKHPIQTTFDLVKIIEASVPKGYLHGRIHPATKTFQALRITVNDELEALTEFIEKSIALLAGEGRLVIISFHSLEDRIVKHLFKDFAKSGKGIVLTKKPMTPSREEVVRNPRARSAKLRIFKKNEET